METGEIFEQPKAAAEKAGIHPSNITQVCRGEQLSAGGFHWKYVNETEQQREKREALIESSSKKDLGEYSRVRVLCVETEIVYPSLKNASDELGINRCGISNALRGKSKTAGGFHWKYAED